MRGNILRTTVGNVVQRKTAADRAMPFPLWRDRSKSRNRLIASFLRFLTRAEIDVGLACVLPHIAAYLVSSRPDALS
ncbi:hypothetical protein MTO96_019863 [Rhipicephalus appendiculatus]